MLGTQITSPFDAAQVAHVLNHFEEHLNNNFSLPIIAPQQDNKSYLEFNVSESPSIFDQAYQRSEQKHQSHQPPQQAASQNELYENYLKEQAAPKPYEQAPASEQYYNSNSRALDNTQSQVNNSFINFDQNLTVGNVNVGILFSEPSLILALAIIIEWIIPLPKSFKISALTNIFSGLSRKVNRPNSSDPQRSFAGSFLSLLILLTILFLVFTLDAFSGFDSLISLVVMIWVLELKYPQDRAIYVNRALHEGFKEKAKNLLSDLVLRETQMLSEMGIAKATCEGAILRIFSGWFSVIVWYFIAGIEGAVLMQTINLLSRAYNYKLRGNHHFGQFVFRMHQIMIAIPAAVLMVFLFVSKNPVRHIAYAKEGFSSFPAPISGLVLGAIGGSLNIALGGPRYYQGNIMRLPKIGGENNPDNHSILYAMRKIRMCGLLLLVVSILIDLNF